VIIRDFAKAVQTMQRQREMIRVRDRAILALARGNLDLAVGWRISMEQPEIDLRDEVDEMIRVIHDELARLEERIVL
jgi:hypothetical protein